MKIPVDTPEASGVYIIWHQERAHYVGMAKNLRKRLVTHDRRWEFDRLEGEVRVEFRQCPLHLIRSEERRLIQELRPRANGLPIGCCVADPVKSAESMIELFEMFNWFFRNGPLPRRLQ